MSQSRQALLQGQDVSSLVDSWGNLEDIKTVLLADATPMVAEHDVVIRNRSGFLSMSGPGSMVGGTYWYGKDLRILIDGVLQYQGVILDIQPDATTGRATVKTGNALRRAADNLYSGSGTAQNPADAILAIARTAFTSDQLDLNSFFAAGGPARRAGATVTYAWTTADSVTVLGAMQAIAAISGYSLFTIAGQLTLRPFIPYQSNSAGLRFPLQDLLVRQWSPLTHDYENFNNQVNVGYPTNQVVTLDDVPSQLANAGGLAPSTGSTSAAKRKRPYTLCSDGDKAKAADAVSARFFGSSYLQRAAFRRGVLRIAGGEQLGQCQLGDRHPVTQSSLGLFSVPFEVIQVNRMLDGRETELTLVELFDPPLPPAVPVIIVPKVKFVLPKPTWDDLLLSYAPLGYWKGDELAGTVLADASGNGRSMNLSGNYALNQGSMLPSGLGTSIHWIHSSPDGGAAMPANDTALDLTTKGTILIWNGGAVNGLLDWGIAKDGGAAGYGILFPNNNSITAYTRSGGTFTINAGYTGGTNIWAALTWNGTTAKLYLNGVLVASAIGTWPGVAATTTPMTIGTNSQSSNNENNFFTRAAVFGTDLTQAQLTALAAIA